MASNSEYFNPRNFERRLASINSVGEREREREREREGREGGRERENGRERERERFLHVEFI